MVTASIFAIGCERSLVGTNSDSVTSLSSLDGAVFTETASVYADSVDFFITVFNDTDVRVEIVGMKSSCDCVGLSLPVVIEPNRQVTLPIKVQVETNGLSSMEREIQFVTNQAGFGWKISLILNLE